MSEYKELETDYDELDKVNRKLNKELTDHMATIRLIPANLAKFFLIDFLRLC